MRRPNVRRSSNGQKFGRRFLFLLNFVLLGIVASEVLTAFYGVALAALGLPVARLIELAGEAGADAIGGD